MIDALAHLDDPRIANRPALLQRAAGAGVTDVVSGGVDPGVPSYPWPTSPVRIWRALGLHPRAIRNLPEQIAALQQQLGATDVRAVGEIGLDGRAGMPPDDLQEVALRRQLGLAQEYGLPVILHCVKRLGRLLEILEADGLPEAGGVLHAFAGPPELVPRWAQLGLYFSFGGLVARPVAKRCRAALPVVPRHRLLVESDAPDHPIPGLAASEPAMLAPLLQQMAVLCQVAPTELSQLTAANARTLYKLPAGDNNRGNSSPQELQ